MARDPRFNTSLQLYGLDIGAATPSEEYLPGPWAAPLPVPPEPQPEPDPNAPPKPKPPSIGTTPGSVPVVPSAWNTTTTPATYQLQGGDTFVGLAKTYLRDGTRWRELYNFQDAAWRQSHPSPDVIFAGDRIKMPAEAEDNYRQWLTDQKQPQPAGPRKMKAVAKSVPWWGWILGGGAVAGLAYGGYKAFW